MRQHTSRGALLASNLPQLQNLIKRDPVGYRDEFLQQWNHYNSIRELFQSNPGDQVQHLRELASFLSQVAPCYPKEAAEFPVQISNILMQNYAILSPTMRQSLVQNLVTMRNKNFITPIALLQTLFPLLPRTTSPALRTFIRKTILSDIRTANLKTKNHKLNRAVQAMLFAMVERGMEGEITGDKGKARAGAAGEAARQQGGEAMWAVILTKELWRKGIWTDAKTVSILALGCFHPVVKVQSASIHFFLGSEEEQDDDSDAEEEEEVDVKSLQHRREINKKTRSGDKKMAKAVKAAKKQRRDKANKEPPANFPALQLLHDPQSFGEKLFDILSKNDKRLSLDHKVLIMRLLSRVMGSHKLCVLSFYSYLVKYLAYHQLQITTILVALAQSVHELTPPDVLTPVIRKIAHEFIHPGVASQVVAVGLNSIREVCRRQPWCMEEDLLGDLIEYKKSRDKGVMVASRSLLQLYRDVNPGMLKKRDRGKEATMSNRQALPFGHAPDAHVDIEGLDLLEEHIEKQRTGKGDDEEMEDDDEAAWNGWEVGSDSSDSSEGWQDVASEGEDFDVSDSDDEKPKSGGPVGEIEQPEKEISKEPAEEPAEEQAQRLSTLATTKILTPADFALLNELRLKAASESVQKGSGGTSAKRKLAELEATRKANANNTADTFLSEGEILGPRKKAKADYEERMASIQKGREGREKFGSLKGKKTKEAPSSSTNREKARNKPFMMVMASGQVRSKKKASLREKQKKLRAHIDKGKKRQH